MTATAKICGLSTPETLDAAVAGGASHVGFVFYPPSPRHLAFRRAAELAARVPDRVGKVGVFVDPDDALVEQAVEAAGVDTLQIHQAAPDRLQHLRTRFGLELWAAVAIKARADLDEAYRIAPVADRILYDAKTPPGATRPGGMGVRFDWSLLDGFRHPRPWILSGGLARDTVSEAVTRTGATLVDVSSGVETAPGIKDAALIAGFLRAVADL